MDQHIITVPKYKSKSRNIMRMLLKMDECLKYYDAVVVLKDTDCPNSEITEYIGAFHDLTDYNIYNASQINYISKKSSIQPIIKLCLEYGNSETELPFTVKVDEVESDTDTITSSELSTESLPKSITANNSKTRQVMCKVNEELYSKDSWKELDAKGCCVVSVGNLKPDDEVNIEYVKANISHSSVIHKCVNIDMMRSSDRTAIVVILTWKN